MSSPTPQDAFSDRLHFSGLASPISSGSPAQQRQISVSPSQQKILGTTSSPHRTATGGGGRAYSELEEELKSIDMIFSTLSASLEFYQKGTVASSSGANDAEIATPQDAKDFITYFTAVLTSTVAHVALQANDASGKRELLGLNVTTPEAVLTRLVFENGYDVIGILTDLIHAASRKAFVPLRSARIHSNLTSSSSSTAAKGSHVVSTTLAMADDIQNEFAALRIAAIEAIKQLLTLCADCSDRGSSSSLAQLLRAAFTRCETAQRIMTVVLQPTSPSDLRLVAVETLFVFFMRAAQTPNQSTTSSALLPYFEPLLKAVALDPSPAVRCFAAAIVRQFASMFPSSAVVVKSVPSLLRSLQQDDSLDTKSLCAGALESIVRRAGADLDHALIPIPDIVESACNTLDRVFTIIPALSQSVNQMGSSSDPSQLGSLPLLETSQVDFLDALCSLLLAGLEFTLTTVHSDVQIVLRSVALNGTILRLAKLTRVGALPKALRAAATAAKVLKLLAHRTPPFLNIPLLISEPLVAANVITAVVVAPETTDDDNKELARTFLLDLAVTVSCSLLFSPMSRVQWRRVLMELPSWEDVFVQRLSASLSQAELSSFEHMIVVDECGIALNESANVEWDDDSHPSAHSIRCLMDAQEVRRRGKTGSIASSISHWRSLEQSRRHVDTKRGFLCFVLMGYSLLTLTSPPPTRVIPSLLPQAYETGPAVSSSSSPPPPEAISRELYRNVFDDAGEARSGAAAVGGYVFPRLHGEGKQSGSAVAPAPRAAARQQQPVQRHHQQEQKASHTAEIQREPELVHVLRAEFEAALKLTIHLSQHYHRKLMTPEEIAAKAPRFVDGPSRSNLSSSVSRNPKLQNPYAKPQVPHDKFMQLRAWTAKVVEEGDLFFFSIPLSALNATVVDAIVSKARKHQTTAKKNFLTTPQNQRERRWFLLDVYSIVMPKMISMFLTIKKMLSVHSEEHVCMALQVLPSLRVASANNEKIISCSNLVNVCDFIGQTFAIRMSDRDGSFVDAASFVGGGEGSQAGDRRVDEERFVASFFAPLMPRASSTRGPDADGTTKASKSMTQQRPAALFDVPRSSRDSELSAYDDDDDDLELPFTTSLPPNKYYHYNASTSQAAASSVGGVAQNNEDDDDDAELNY